MLVFFYRFMHQEISRSKDFYEILANLLWHLGSLVTLFNIIYN